MKTEVRVFILLMHVTGVILNGDDYSHCTNYAGYHSLAKLMKHDECMTVESVSKLLVDLHLQDNSGVCRNHIISLLGDYFGHDAQTPVHCQCQGVHKPLPYHTGGGDGFGDHRDFCMKHGQYYSEIYNQYFESSNTSDHVVACKTHHSVWPILKNIGHHHSCQKDIIFHLKYAFQHHKDNCTCAEATDLTSNHPDHCHRYDSFQKLLKLGETRGCLSANSVWHYLDDLQVKDSSCREKIQRHMAGLSRHATSHDADCICSEKRTLVNHAIHKMDNGSLAACKNTNGTYASIEADLFSKIESHGCQNHNYLWTKLENVYNPCLWHIGDTCGNGIDCRQDLIVRAAVHYPTDESDSCVCAQVITSTASAISASSTSSVSKSSDLATKAPTPAVTTTTVPTTKQFLSSTFPKVTQSTTTVVFTQQTKPTINFSCNKMAAIEDLAKLLKATHPNASICDPNAGGSDDAFVLSTCNMTSPLTWTKGANVMADCESSTHLIPTYTPISTFDGDNYVSLGSQSGIFLGCTGSGIKMAIQKCNGVPEIVHIENGAFVNNPHYYFVIV